MDEGGNGELGVEPARKGELLSMGSDEEELGEDATAKDPPGEAKAEPRADPVLITSRSVERVC